MADFDIEVRIRKYINENFLFTAGDSPVDKDISLLDSGVIDSTGILEIINFLEEEMGVKVEDEEANRENFESIGAITAFVQSKMSRLEKPEAV